MSIYPPTDEERSEMEEGARDAIESQNLSVDWEQVQEAIETADPTPGNAWDLGQEIAEWYGIRE